MIQKTLLASLILLLPATFAVAQEEGGEDAAAAAPAQAERYPCKSDPKNREFDFWVGNWNVTVQGQQAGTNDIQLILGDCVLFENWVGARGSTGKSFNFYDAAEDHWRQIWVDDRGGVIEFTGEVRDGSMYYTATTNNPTNGEVTEHKLTFTPNADGSVRQHWEQSKDEGANWQTVWDGLYVKMD
jgi:hypothetical protein